MKNYIGYIVSRFYCIKIRFVRFLITGVINTLFSLSIYWALVYLEVHYSVAMLVSNTLGILFNYKTTGKLVFENDSNRLLIRFFLVNLVIYLLSVAILKILFAVGIDKYIGAVFMAPPMAIISFLLSKHYVFTNDEDGLEMKTNSEAYKEHLENKYLPGRDKYLQWIFYPKILRQFNAGEVVDLGCGTGEFVRYLKLRKREVSGIDNNPFLVKKCVDMGFDVKLDDITKLENIKQGIGNALCDNVLEHLDSKQINDFFQAIKYKMCSQGRLVIIVPDSKGFRHDPTHKTFVDRELVEDMCSKYNMQVINAFSHPVNMKLIGDYFYLNMQVFTIRF